jgi:TatD DNase family protein
MHAKDGQLLPTLDAHGHFRATHDAEALAAAGAVLAMTLSPAEAEFGLGRAASGQADRAVVWGAGCHPGMRDAQAAFDPDRFRILAERAAVIGEIGLDFSSEAPRETQVNTFRRALSIAADLGRIVSVHSQNATAAVLDELERLRPPAVILHWWTGDDAETMRAVALGASFSIPESLAAARNWSGLVPFARVLTETDHGYDDPPAAIPGRIERTELILAPQYGLDAAAFRLRVWRTFADIVRAAGVAALLPEGFRRCLEIV